MCKEEDNIRLGYKTAINLMIKEENLFWSQFNVILLANSIFITAISFILFNNIEESKFFIIIATFAGIILCFLWILLTERRHNFRVLFLLCAREIEENHFTNYFQILSRGRNFSKGNEVQFKIDGNPTHRLPCLGSMKVLCWTYLIIAIFIAIYISTLVIVIEKSFFYTCVIFSITIILMSLFGMSRSNRDD